MEEIQLEARPIYKEARQAISAGCKAVHYEVDHAWQEKTQVSKWTWTDCQQHQNRIIPSLTFKQI